MITFDALTLKALTNEISAFGTGAVINKIQQPTRREFIFLLRKNGKITPFYVNINPGFYHCCFMTKITAEKRLIEIPPKPPMFCMLLRKYLVNAKISHINQPENERILEFYIKTYNETGDLIELCLAFEFMGKYSNVILYNTDTGIILGCAHNVGADKSRKREIYGSIPYIYPPKQKKSDILYYNGEFEPASAPDAFYLISKNFAKLCRNCTTEQVKNFVRLKNPAPAISKDFKEYSLFSELLNRSEIIECGTVNEMVDNYYSVHIAADKFKTLQTRYKTLVSQKLNKTEKALKEIEYRISKSNEADKYRLFVDLILANLYNIKDYSSSANVYDYENGEEITVSLDPLKTAKDNANNFYKIYSKSKNAKQKLTELQEDYSAKKSYLEQLLYSVNTAENISDLFEISDEIEEKPAVSHQRAKSAEIMRICPDDTTQIFIGKNNKQNDCIISKLADENDLWFHVKDNPGSHVLLKTTKVTDELILQCAELAKKYSSVKDSSKIGVIYTKRKYIRKPPKANLGYVTYRNEKEIVVD